MQPIEAPPAGPLAGPARLRWRLRAALHAVGIPYLDTLGIGTIGAALDERAKAPNADPNWSATLLALRQAGYRGLVQGLGDAARLGLVGALAHALHQTALVAVADSAVEYRWQRAAAAAGLADVVTPARITGLARDMHWLGARHDLLVVDTPEAMPHGALAQACDASAALARVGLVTRIDSSSAARWATGIGPLVTTLERRAGADHVELRTALPDEVRAGYEAAWHTFLAAFDRFAAARPNAGFGTFVQQARDDPMQRPALRAWHEAVRLAAWHAHKAAMVAELLQRHRGRRTLVFTPDRRAAYELAGRHLIPAITAEIPRAERQAMLDAFHRGSLPALAGPRLLDLGIAEGTADVAILVGGGYGRDQRDARVRRVRRDGLVYELTTLDTVEVSRAHRWRSRDVAAARAVHDR
ncbi:MAG: hypothetical protein JNM25_09485 [Planctomycetes bacterium]|nr:hypothetical protein [Planctomycetota bacterium]